MKVLIPIGVYTLKVHHNSPTSRIKKAGVV